MAFSNIILVATCLLTIVERSSSHVSITSGGHLSGPSHLDADTAALLSMASADHEASHSSDLVRRHVTKHAEETGDTLMHAHHESTHPEKQTKRSIPEAVPKGMGLVAVAAMAEPAMEEMSEVEDDTVLATDHICGGDSHEVERYPGPTERLLIECRQACMDDGKCMFYAYWPEKKDGKNLAGACQNSCRLYDTCLSHAEKSDAIPDTETCRAYLLKLGEKSQADRPPLAAAEAAAIKAALAKEGRAHSSTASGLVFFVALLGMSQ